MELAYVYAKTNCLNKSCHVPGARDIAFMLPEFTETMTFNAHHPQRHDIARQLPLRSSQGTTSLIFSSLSVVSSFRSSTSFRSQSPAAQNIPKCTTTSPNLPSSPTVPSKDDLVEIVLRECTEHGHSRRWIPGIDKVLYDRIKAHRHLLRTSSVLLWL